MNKCQSEFEGSICPTCGEELSNEVQKSKKSVNHKILTYIPLIAFAVFVVLMGIMMYKLPVAKVNLYDLNEKFGSVFNADRFDEIAGLSALSAIMLIGYVAMILCLIFFLLFRAAPAYKYTKTFNKPFYKIMEIISSVLVLVYLVFDFVMIGQIKAADHGLKIIKLGSYPILSTILTFVCLIVIVGSLVLCYIQEKTNPKIMENWLVEREQAKEKAKTSKNRKENQGPISKVISVVLILGLVILGSKSAFGSSGVSDRFITDKSFNVEILEKLLSNNSNNIYARDITEKIGNPDESPDTIPSDGIYDVTYYTSEYSDLLKQAKYNQKYLLVAIENGDRALVSEILKRQKNLEEEKEVLAYGKLKIEYTRNPLYTASYVEKAAYNSMVVNDTSLTSKQLKSVSVYNVNEVSATEGTKKIESITYLAKYTDGSFIYATCENVNVVLDNGTTSNTYEGSYSNKTFKWNDEFGTYEQVISSIYVQK